MIPPLFGVWSFRLLVAPGGVELRPRRSSEVRGSPELQNGGLRALEDVNRRALLQHNASRVINS